MEDKLKNRNKLIRIAGSSEGGWETVRQYEASPLADDSEDESRLKRAEPQTATRHVTHLSLVALLLVLVTHGRPHRGNVCLLPFKDRIIPVEASELSQQRSIFWSLLRPWIIQSFQEDLFAHRLRAAFQKHSFKVKVLGRPRVSSI